MKTKQIFTTGPGRVPENIFKKVFVAPKKFVRGNDPVLGHGSQNQKEPR